MARKRKTPDDLENTPIELKEKPRVDMSDSLGGIRRVLSSYGYARVATDAAGEIWVHRTVPWRWTLLSDPDGTLRAELRDPAGGIRTEVRPATPEDVEAAMPL